MPSAPPLLSRSICGLIKDQGPHPQGAQWSWHWGRLSLSLSRLRRYTGPCRWGANAFTARGADRRLEGDCINTPASVFTGHKAQPAPQAPFGHRPPEKHDLQSQGHVQMVSIDENPSECVTLSCPVGLCQRAQKINSIIWDLKNFMIFGDKGSL